MHCWCPSATGPNQPHQSDCFQHTRLPLSKLLPYKFGHGFGPGPSLGSSLGFGLPYKAKLSDMALQADAALQAKAYALEWTEAHTVPASIQCTCAAKSGVIGHAAFCPLGEKAETLATVTILEPGAADATYIDLETEWL